MPRIRFPTRIAHATDEEESKRYALQGTLVTPEGFAVATDGRIAACVKVNVDGLDAPTMIPQELGPSSKADLKAEYHANGQQHCEKYTLVKGQQRVEQADVRDGRFPKVGGILNGIDSSQHVVLAIDAQRLWRLAQAINVPDTGDIVVLLVPVPKEGEPVTEVVGVLSNHDSYQDAGGFGVIMPCDAEAVQARAKFKKLREGAVASMDAAAKAWSERCVAESRKEEAAAKPLKPARRTRRKRSVA